MGEVISTRNGVPPQGNVTASDPPGGLPRKPDTDREPHQVPVPDVQDPDLPENEPPQVPPTREAHRRNHHRPK